MYYIHVYVTQIKCFIFPLNCRSSEVSCVCARALRVPNCQRLCAGPECKKRA